MSHTKISIGKRGDPLKVRICASISPEALLAAEAAIDADIGRSMSRVIEKALISAFSHLVTSPCPSASEPEKKEELQCS